MKKNSVFFFLFFFTFCSVAQTTIIGSVSDLNGLPIPNVSVVIKKTYDGVVESYTYTKNDGTFIIKTQNKNELILTLSALGYKEESFSIVVSDSVDTITQKVVMQEEGISLNEVIVTSEKSIRRRKDTIIFKASKFANGTEQLVEDLLKKIPGVSVDQNGTIKVGNKEIEKLMIDGDDIFEKGYKILSKNMPAHPIEEIEILQKYSNNRLLKNIEESEKVAINLKLKDEMKRIWFGNIEVGVGNSDFYQIKGNLMNFGKRNKYFFLSNLNNIGFDSTGDLDNLIRPMKTDEIDILGDNQHLRNLINLSPDALNFKRNRTNFNNSEMVSLNAIFNPTEKLKIKTLGFFNWDEKDFFKNTIDNVNVADVNFTNTEEYQLRNKKRIGFGKVDLTYNISKTKMLESTTKYNIGDFNDSSDLVFNGNSTTERLQHQNTLFDQKISYTNKFEDTKVFLLTGRFIDERGPQNYRVDQFFFEDLFPETDDANNVLQKSTNQMQFAGLNAHLLDRKVNGHLLELQLGNEYRKDKLSTAFSILENDMVLDTPNGYQNQTTYQVNDLYLKGKYRLKINDFALVAKMDAHQLFNHLENKDLSKNQQPFFVNPSLGADWKINDANKITTSYSYNTTNATLLNVFSDFVLTGFRSFYKGTGNFNQLDASSFVINYQLGNWSDRFFANTFIVYSKNHDFFTTNTTLNRNFSQSQTILIKDREFISVNSKLDYYFKFIASNLKLDVGYSKSEFKNSINNSELREVVSNNYNYGFELRSGFKGIFNFHIGTKWMTNEIKTTIDNSFTDNVSFLDLTFVFNKKLDFQLESERYFFGNLMSDNTYYFLDFDAHYKLIENKLTLGITGKNLFNTERFRNFSVSDIGTSTTEYRLLPRFVLLKMEYRF